MLFWEGWGVGGGVQKGIEQVKRAWYWQKNLGMAQWNAKQTGETLQSKLYTHLSRKHSDVILRNCFYQILTQD